jgi:hypothetical protein
MALAPSGHAHFARMSHRLSCRFVEGQDAKVSRSTGMCQSDRTGCSHQVSTTHHPYKKSRREPAFFMGGGSCWIRTSDQLVKSQLLYQLS